MLKMLSVSSDLYILTTVWAQKKANPDSFKPGFIQTFAESEVLYTSFYYILVCFVVSRNTCVFCIFPLTRFFPLR